MSRVDDFIGFLLKHRVLKHVFFWLAFFMSSLVYGLGMGEMPLVSVYLEGIYLPIQIAATYVFMYWQLPLLYKKKYWLFGVTFIIVSYLFTSLAHINYDYGIGTNLISWHKPHAWIALLTKEDFFLTFFVDVYVIVLMATAIKLVVEYFETRTTIEHLEADKMKSEYTLLQSKMQPAFLLRSLKYIAYQSERDIDAVPPNIADLSEILDHTLYGSRNKVITVTEAVEKLRTYLRLYVVGSELLVETQISNRLVVDPNIVPLCLMKMTEEILFQFQVKIQLLLLDISSQDESIIVKYVVAPKEENTGCHIGTKSVTDVLDLMYPQHYDIVKEEENILSIRIDL